MYRRKDANLQDLAALKTQNERVRFVQEEYIKNFLQRYERGGWDDARNHWDGMITIPEQLGAAWECMWR